MVAGGVVVQHLPIDYLEMTGSGERDIYGESRRSSLKCRTSLLAHRPRLAAKASRASPLLSPVDEPQYGDLALKSPATISCIINVILKFVQ